MIETARKHVRTLLHSPLSTRRRRGMTLIELLVVVSIMVMLVAISVPTFKPMLESQRSAGGARAVSLTLQRARVKAACDKRTYGVEFMRFHDGNAPNLSLQMRLMRSGYNFVEIDDGIRVRVEPVGGVSQIKIYYFDNSIPSGGNAQDQNWGWKEAAAGSSYWAKWNDKVKPGYAIQLGRQGRFYKLADNSNVQLASPYNNLTFPTNDFVDSNGNPVSAVEVNVLQTPRTTLTPVVVLPRGTVVDLQYSSFDNYYEPYDLDDPSASLNSNGIFRSFNSFDSNAGGVGVMFSPSGHVDRCYYFDANNNYQELKPHGGLFYFCIGEWDRQGTASNGDTLAEDGRNNLMTPSNFWVTVNPRNGQVRVAEMGAIPSWVRTEWNNATTDAAKIEALRKMLAPTRKYATDHFTNIGGF